MSASRGGLRAAGRVHSRAALAAHAARLFNPQLTPLVCRRLSIISLPNETKAERGADEKDAQGPVADAGAKGDRRRRLSIVGLYTGEVIQAEDELDVTGKRSPASRTVPGWGLP